MMRFVAKNKNPRILRQFFPPGGSGGAAPPSPASTLTARGAGGSPTAAAAATATTSGRRGSARGSVKAEERGAANDLFCTKKDSEINVTKYIDRAGKSLDLELEGELDEEEEKEEEVEDICNLEIRGGPCFALEEAWGYNSTIGR